MLHITPVTITAKSTHQCADCGTGGVDSTAGGTFNGSVIDRLALGANFTHAQPFLIGTLPGATSTAGAKWRSVAVKLRHGDSSVRLFPPSFGRGEKLLLDFHSTATAILFFC